MGNSDKPADTTASPQVQLNPLENYQKTRNLVGYVPRIQADAGTYQALGFKCGLEIHQQLLTKQKLFCRCPAGIYQRGSEFDSEIIRHMRPTLSEMGEYDGTALMEKKTRKNITYRIKNETACTYEFDDTPPFKINQEALDIAIEVALMLKTNVVGELHITRKQYLDGSIPTGFQRTAIVGIEGNIPLRNKKVGIIQISIEEDACREVSDIGHERIYTTDRLGMPLIETVTYPHLLTPDEAAEAAHYLRFLVRSTGKVRTGIGAARQDVNVSIDGGTRVEIKGVAHIRWIPELTHIEAYRQKALLAIRKQLRSRIENPEDWRLSYIDIEAASLAERAASFHKLVRANDRAVVVNLPGFAGTLSFFTQPEKIFADELSDRLKVIACLEKPNLIHSEEFEPRLTSADWLTYIEQLRAEQGGAQVIVWGKDQDVNTALDVIQERCLMAMEGVPNETRKSLPDGTTIFERVLPGPDRMYPDTDSAPLPISQDRIDTIRETLPADVSARIQQLREWNVPPDCHAYILRRNLVPLMEDIINNFHASPVEVGVILGQVLKNVDGKLRLPAEYDFGIVYRLWQAVYHNEMQTEIIPKMLPLVCERPQADFEDLLDTMGHVTCDIDELLARVPDLLAEFENRRTSKSPEAEVNWVMGQLRPDALGNVPLELLYKEIIRMLPRE